MKNNLHIKMKMLWITLLGISMLLLSYVGKGQTALYENFDGGVLPAGWVSNSKADGSGIKVWLYTNTSTRCATTDHTSGSGKYAMLDDYNIQSSENPVNLVTKSLNLSSGSYTLEFYAWVGSSAGTDPIRVDISTDDGASWIPDVYTVTKAVTGSWVKHTLNLSSYNTSTVKIKFKGYSVYAMSNNNSAIDDIKVFIPLNNDLTANSISTSASIIRDGDNVTLTASVINTGLNSQSNINVDFKVDGTSIGTETIAAIAPGETKTAQRVWTASSGNHTLSFNIPNDEDNGNNTASNSVTVYGANALIENFEGTWIPSGWSINPTTSSWQQQTFGQYEGTKCAYISTSSSPEKRLITPKLVINGTSNIKFYGKNGSYGTYNIKLQYSTDKSVWTDVPSGSVALTTTYQDFTINLSTIPAGNYYISFTYSLSYTSIYIDLVRGPDKAVEAPNAAVNPTPANAITNISRTPTLSWAAASTGGIPSAYKVYLGTDGAGTSTPTNLVNGTSQTATTYVPVSALSYNTTYYWQIVPTNSVSDASNCPIWSFTTLPDPTQTLPYSQDFESGTTPTGWNLVNFSIQTYGTTASKSLSVDMSYLTTASATICPVGPLASSTQIVFDYRICIPTYSNYPQQGYSLTALDKVEVMVSDNDGASFTPIYTIDQASHTTATSFTKKYVTLGNSYNGKNIITKIVTTTGGGDFQVDIDNLLVRETPTNPSFSINATAIDFGFNVITKQPTTILNISNTGGGTLNIAEGDITLTGTNASDFTIGNVTYPISLGVGESTNVDVKFTPNAAGVKNATLSIIHNASGSPASVSLAGESYNAYTAFVEGLETTVADETPKGWTITNIGWAYAGVVANATKAHSGTNYIEMGKWSTDYCYAATPAVGNITLNRLKFWAKSSAASTSISIGTMTDPGNPATYTEFQNVPLTTTYAQYIVDFSSYSGTDMYLAFKTPAAASNPYLSVDDIVWEANPTTPVLGLGATSLNFGLSVAKVETNMAVQILNEGVGTLTVQQADIAFTGDNSSEFKLSESNSFPLELTKGQTANIQVIFSPATAGSKSASMVINHNGSNAAGNVALSGGALPQGSLLENFNATTFPSNGWVAESGWVRQTYSAFEGAGHAYFSPTTNATEVKLKTPLLNIHPNDSLVFYTKTTATSPYPTMKVMYAESVDGPWTQIGTDISVNNSNYAKQKIDLNSLAGSKYYVAFAVTCNSYISTYLDLVTGPRLYTTPEFKSTANTSAFANHSYTYNVVTSDVDADNLIITATTLPSWLSLVDHSNGTATLSGTPTESGSHSVVLSVSDGVTSVEQSFSIVVESNEAPAFTSSPVLDAKTGHSYSYSITTSDAENNDRTITIEIAPAWLGITDNGDGTAILSGTPTSSGDASVVLQLYDGLNTTMQNFTITVVANAVPQISSTALTNGTVGTEYAYNITAADSDNEAIAITATVKPTWITITDNGNGTATLSGTPTQAGNYDVTIQVSDGIESSTQVFAINVIATGINEFSIQNIKVYPNPARDVVFIKYVGNITTVSLFDITGRQIRFYSNTTSIDVTSIPSGLYLLKIECTDGVVVKRIEVFR